MMTEFSVLQKVHFGVRGTEYICTPQMQKHDTRVRSDLFLLTLLSQHWKI